MHSVIAVILFLGLLSGCAKKPIVRPEAPPEEHKYIERFHSGEDPDQWEMFREQIPGAAREDEAELKRMFERMKTDPAYSNQLMKQINRL